MPDTEQITSKNMPKEQLPIGGTLGILAYGYKGIMMWRQVRHEAEQKRIVQLQKANQSNEKN